MDKEQRGSMILTFLEVNFPGGIAAFTETGGLISEIPFEENGVLLYHPQMPQSLIEKIEGNNDRSHMPGAVKIFVVHDYNFKGMEPSEIGEKLQEVMEILGSRYKIPMMLVNLSNSLVFNIILPMTVLNHEEINDFCETFTDHIPSLVRGILILNDGSKYPFSNEGTYRVDTQQRELKSMESERGVITQDAITDLKIALSDDLDVNDIIERL